MPRTELTRLLAILIRQRQISADEAQTMLRLFDAGDLDPRTLPVPFAESNRALEWAAALAAVALLLGAGDGRRLLTRQPIALFVRQRVRDRLRDAFDRRMTRLAEQLTTSGNVRVWHTTVAAEVGQNVARQFIAGAGRVPVAERIALAAAVATQMAFLYRFAGHVAVRVVTGRPLSAGYVANRSRQYANPGLQSWYQGSEIGLGAGYVERYIARDDDGVCRGCAPHHNQVFLPGEGVFPGQACFGSCRCRREPEYNVAEWERLTGRRMAA